MAKQAKPKSCKRRARTIKRDAHALYLAARDPRVAWYPKALAIALAGYALSPIDLIPDFVPVLGYVDDLIIVPLGIALVIRLIPPEIMTQHRDMASAAQEWPISRAVDDLDCDRLDCDALSMVMNVHFWPKADIPTTPRYGGCTQTGCSNGGERVAARNCAFGGD